MRGPTKNAALPTVPSPSNLVAVGRKLDHIPMTRPICWKKTIGNNRRADRRSDQCTVRVAVATGALISGNGFGSFRRSYKSPTTDRSRGRHPRPLKRVCWFDITMAGLAPNRPHASHGSLSFPTRLRLRMTQHCLPAAQCIRATLFGKVDDLQFAPLCGHILIRKLSLSHAWLCSMAQVEPLEATGS